MKNVVRIGTRDDNLYVTYHHYIHLYIYIYIYTYTCLYATYAHLSSQGNVFIARTTFALRMQYVYVYEYTMTNKIYPYRINSPIWIHLSTEITLFFQLTVFLTNFNQ